MSRSDNSNGWIIRRVIVLIILILVAIFPKIFWIFQNEAASIFEKILGVLLLLGGIFMIWFFVALVFMMLNIFCWWIWEKVSRMEYDSEDEKKGALQGVIYVAAVVSAVVVVVSQFIDAWGIDAEPIKWALSVVFPFIR